MEKFTPRLQVLISTINAGFFTLGGITRLQHPDLGYLIVHQQDNYQDDEAVTSLKEKLRERSDIRIVEANHSGLSKSRNTCIENATAEIVLIADDDIEYSEGFVATILNFFDCNSCDVATFMITSSGSSAHRRPYRSLPHRHNAVSILSVSSIEIAFRLTPVKRNKISFDERFGLGSSYPISEEAIFLKDCLSRKLKLISVPRTIVRHQHKSSGTDWSNEKAWFSKGAVFRRMYGPLGILFVFALALKKRAFYKYHYSMSRFILCNIRSFMRFKSDRL